MLDKQAVKEIADLFFNGKPEEAYKKVSNMSEWDQFINSIKKDSNNIKAYHIMAESDLTEWNKNTKPPYYKEYPTYDIGY